MDDRHNLTAADDAIDRKMEQLLSVDPAPEFLARVRMQIAADEPMATPSSRALTAIAVAVFVTAVALWVGFTPNERADVPTIIQTPRPRTAELLPAESPSVPSSVAKPMNVHAQVDVSRPLIAQAAAGSMPEVLISASDAAAFEQFVTSARERRFELSPDSVARLADMSSRTELMIPPIAIDVLSPIEPLAPSEGVNQ
jgi:hypothetical protein